MKTWHEMTLRRGLGNLSLADSQYNTFDGLHINPELSLFKTPRKIIVCLQTV